MDAEKGLIQRRDDIFRNWAKSKIFFTQATFIS